MIKLHCIASGSKGNASLIFDDKTLILVDLGITKERLIEGLNEIGKSIEDIQFAFFTHDHSDHIKNYYFIDENKCYALSKTIPLKKENVLKAYNEYTFNTFKVIPLKTSHDASSPCGFLFINGLEKLAYITDTGKIDKLTLKYINNADYYYFESNYNDEMLINSGRTQILINRIMSNKGHLSNDQSAYYLSLLMGPNTKKVMLCHLSEECNTEEVALDTHYEAYNKLGIDISNIVFKCAKQWESVDL